ncbi:hypothetical protein BGZ79_004598, partial [Entomortierella chlamydospora]
MSNFVSHFGLNDRESATRSFQELLQSSQIPQKRREDLQAAFNYFQMHHEEKFWVKRALKHNTKVIATKAACAVQDAGLQEAEIAFEERRATIIATKVTSTPAMSVLKDVVEDQNLRKDNLHHEMPAQKKPRICSSPSSLHGASSISLCHTPPYHQGSAESSPETFTNVPPSPLDLTFDDETEEHEAHSFFTSSGSSQDILFSNLQDGNSISPWAKNRPLYTFKLQLQEEWGPRVTDLYEAAKTKPVLDHTHIDEIA